jgi:hypothetical protein
VQRKAITALSVLLVALALAACGDGGEETTVSTPATEQAQRPQTPEQVQGRAEEIEEERRAEPEGEAQKPADNEPSQAPAPAPAPAHQDSGGGAAQFQRKGSDNSIQEFGQEGGGAEFAAAAATLHAFLDARAAGRWEDACSYLAAEVVASLEQFAAANSGESQLEGCPQILQTLSSGAGAAGLRAMANADVGSLRVQGGRGFLLYHGPQGVDFAMPVTAQGGEWKLSAPEATPLP